MDFQRALSVLLGQNFDEVPQPLKSTLENVKEQYLQKFGDFITKLGKFYQVADVLGGQLQQDVADKGFLKLVNNQVNQMFKAKERLIDSFYEDFKETCQDYLGDNAKMILEKCKISQASADAIKEKEQVQSAPRIEPVSSNIEQKEIELGKRAEPSQPAILPDI